nr:vegetative cell wall protein gp1-like [Aegilops tauschii subsp. strangulata]
MPYPVVTVPTRRRHSPPRPLPLDGLRQPSPPYPCIGGEPVRGHLSPVRGHAPALSPSRSPSPPSSSARTTPAVPASSRSSRPPSRCPPACLAPQPLPSAATSTRARPRQPPRLPYSSHRPRPRLAPPLAAGALLLAWARAPMGWRPSPSNDTASGAAASNTTICILLAGQKGALVVVLTSQYVVVHDADAGAGAGDAYSRWATLSVSAPASATKKWARTPRFHCMQRNHQTCFVLELQDARGKTAETLPQQNENTTQSTLP